VSDFAVYQKDTASKVAGNGDGGRQDALHSGRRERGTAMTERTAGPPWAGAATRQRMSLSGQARGLRTAWFLAWTVVIVCAAILLFGYVAGYERLYQPWPNGPSTHPFTASALALLALGTIFNRPFHRSWLSTAAFVIALSIGLVRLADIIWGWHILDNIAPFPDVLARHSLSGSPITLGWNTALAIVAASSAGLSQIIVRPLLAQFLAAAALAPPLVSIVGYSYGLHAFYGQMSVYSTVILLAACIAILLSKAHRSVVSMVLSNYTAGRMARHLIFAVLAIPFGGGMLVARLNDLDNDAPVAVLVVSVALGNVAVMLRTLIEVEKLDRTRRRVERATEFEASHDPLTTLVNRRYFASVAKHAVARAKRFGSTLSVVMFDIDHFKKVNDSFGHQIGDHVLACVGHVFSRTHREGDVIGRYGGEEFVALLPDTNLSGAFQWAEKLRSAIGSEIIRDAAGNAFSITVSAGVVEKSATEDSFEQVVKRADHAMYAAKSAGRNCTCATPFVETPTKATPNPALQL